MRLSDLRSLCKFYLRQWMGTGSGKKILDVGSGHHPHEDATHLVDLLPEDDSERGKPIKTLGRPLVLATVESLPFKDKSFDYVYACHVLEHTPNPEAACKELMRIARSGYIETPSPFYEQGYNYPRPDRGWSFHRWFVYLDESDRLIFEPKTHHTIDKFCNCRYAQFIKRIYGRVDDLNRIHRILPHECNYTVLRWVDQFKFEVKNQQYKDKFAQKPTESRTVGAHMEPRHLTMPVVSVVIAVYNGERFLRDALNSLFAQSFQDFEVICVDNGSSDDSLNVIEDVAQSTREIRVIRHAPRGQSEARNAGAAQARGRYIAFLDQDDVWYTDKLLHQVRVLEERSDVVLVHSDVDFIEDAGKVTKRRVTSKARRTASRSPLAQLIGMELCFILPSALLVRKAAFEAVGGFDPALIRGEDYDLCWRLAPQGRFEFIDSPAVGYRFHAGNFSQSVGGASFNGDEGYKSGERFYLKLLDHYSSDSHKRMLARRLLAECYSGWGKYKVNVGVRRGGRTLLLRSLRYNPWRFRTYSRILRSYLPLWVGR